MAEKSDEVNLTVGDKLLAKQHVEKPYLGVEEDDEEYGTRSFISKEDEDKIRKIYAVIRKNSFKCCETITKNTIPWTDDSFCGRRISYSTEDDDEIKNILNINTMVDIDPIYTMTTRPNSCIHQNSKSIVSLPVLQGSYSTEDNEIKDILNSNTFDEDSTSNMPFRQKSRCLYREIKLKLRDKNNSLKITNKISLNNSCETITENIMNRNDDCCSQADDVISSTTQFLDGSTEPSLLKDDFITVDARTHERLSKNTSPDDNAVIKRKRITRSMSQEVEVLGSTCTDSALYERKRITRSMSKEVEVLGSTCTDSALYERKRITRSMSQEVEVLGSTCTDSALYERKRITRSMSQEVEVMGSSDEVDLCGKSFKIKPSNENQRSSSSNLNRRKIKEKYDNLSTIKTPMNDATSPFFINEELEDHQFLDIQMPLKAIIASVAALSLIALFLFLLPFFFYSVCN